MLVRNILVIFIHLWIILNIVSKDMNCTSVLVKISEGSQQFNNDEKGKFYSLQRKHYFYALY